MKVIIGSDHAGFEVKQALTKELGGRGIEVLDAGCFSTDSVDYPDIAFEAAKAVAEGRCDRGILVCGTGIGMSVCANKVDGVRCALCGDTLTAKLTRQHNDSNMLALGARITGIELIKAIVDTWLGTEFLGGRHERRIAKISEYEHRR